MKINTEKARSSIKEDWEDIKREPIKRTIDFLKVTIKTIIITIIILYFLSRPLECKTTNNETLKIEEIKFNQKEITKCDYTIIKDFKQIYKATTTKVIINKTEEEIPWEKTTTKNP